MSGRVVLLMIAVLWLTGCAQQQAVPSQAPVIAQTELAAWVAQTLTALAPTAAPVEVTPSPAALLVDPTMALAVLNQTSTPLPPSSTPVPTRVTETRPAPTSTPEITKTSETRPTATLAPSPTPEPTRTLPTATSTASPSAAPTTVSTIPADSTAAKPIPNTSECIDKAGFFADVTIPDRTLLPMNTEFTKTWRFRNEGTCTWGEGYQLVFARGQILGGPPSSPIPRAAPGELIEVSVKMKTPAQGGTYAGDWQFQNPSGKRFGVNSHGEDYFFVIIRVDWGPGVGPSPTPPPVNCAYERNSAYEAQLLQLVNSTRAAKGLPPLSLQGQLTAAALAHSADMACFSYLDHRGSDGSTYSVRIKGQGYKAAYDSENIYAGGNAQDAFDWWMNSQVHRDNILSSKITQIGIGYAYYSRSKFGGYYTLTFGRP